jgi:hypothetical protein
MVVCSLSNTATRIYTNTGEAFNLIFFSPFHLAGNKGTTCSNDSAATFIAPAIKGRSAQPLQYIIPLSNSHLDTGHWSREEEGLSQESENKLIALTD